MSDFERLDRLLAHRADAPVSPGLEGRILAGCLDRGKRKTFWSAISDLFVLPHPEYALAASLAVGLSLGLQLDGRTEILDIVNFLYAAEGWL